MEILILDYSLYATLKDKFTPYDIVLLAIGRRQYEMLNIAGIYVTPTKVKIFKDRFGILEREIDTDLGSEAFIRYIREECNLK